MDQLDQHQLQAVCTELIVEQYRSLREEIIQRVQARQQMWYVPTLHSWHLLYYWCATRHSRLDHIAIPFNCSVFRNQLGSQ